MTIRRKDEEESELDKRARVAKTAVSNFSPRSEKTSWLRKQANMEAYIEANINPVEEIIQNKHSQLMEHFKQIELMDDEQKRTYAAQNIIPLQDEIQQMQLSLFPHLDEVESQRKEMVSTCIHPYEELRYEQDTGIVRCTFCNKKLLHRG